jgi:SAM-dependent methyltransferase
MPSASELVDSPAWRAWAVLQSNGVVSYNADPEHNLGVGERKDFLEFAEFCSFSGIVLDVGVGPQRVPSHIEHSKKPGVRFVGIDPLVGQQPRGFEFVHGLGEFLPFRAGLFDQVLFVTSLDHFIDPRPALLEARRVLNATGHVCIWLGEKSSGAPRPKVSNEWYENLEVPPGAEDRFHYKRYSADEIESWFNGLGLTLVQRDVRNVDEWRRNLFYRLASAQ